jgi:hypothetical protein
MPDLLDGPFQEGWVRSVRLRTDTRRGYGTLLKTSGVSPGDARPHPRGLAMRTTPQFGTLVERIYGRLGLA